MTALADQSLDQKPRPHPHAGERRQQTKAAEKLHRLVEKPGRQNRREKIEQARDEPLRAIFRDAVNTRGMLYHAFGNSVAAIRSQDGNEPVHVAVKRNLTRYGGTHYFKTAVEVMDLDVEVP